MTQGVLQGTAGGTRLEGAEDCGGRMCHRLAERLVAPPGHQEQPGQAVEWSLLVDQRTFLPVRGAFRSTLSRAHYKDGTLQFTYQGLEPIVPPTTAPATLGR